ncbi:MAG: hypothetical protein KGI38_06185 [Thaumarchaeota archaeon]|nr:hypothetical protein [Nitrososphaerota archaeon]
MDMRNGTRTTIGLLFLGILVGASISYALFSATLGRSQNYGTSSTSSSSFNGGASCSVAKGDLPPTLFQFVVNALDNKHQSLSQSEFYSNFTSLFSNRNFDNSSALMSQFEFSKEPGFNPEMYAGNPTTSLWEYPAQVEIGSQGGLLLVYIQVLYLCGSPYGNSSNRGSNVMTLFLHSGSWTYGLGEVSAMESGSFSSDLAVLNGEPILTPDGLYVYDSLNFLPHNQTYYFGPSTYSYPWGSGSYDAPHTANATGFVWSSALIAGSFNEPLTTRYFFVLNSSKIPHPNDNCLGLQLMFNLTSLSPYPSSTSSGFQVTDSFPTHRIDAPLNYSNYLQISVPIA